MSNPSPHSTESLRLGVNVDHVATIRNARGGSFPDPVRAAQLAEAAGADGITAHLREDRRHISDNDIERLANELTAPLNFEMAATPEMLKIALKLKPHAACIVPEKREELTTEGGLDVVNKFNQLKPYVNSLNEAGILVSLDGYSFPYYMSTALASHIYLFAGLLILFNILKFHYHNMNSKK